MNSAADLCFGDFMVDRCFTESDEAVVGGEFVVHPGKCWPLTVAILWFMEIILGTPRKL